ncbi:MAG: PD-(D/E)XK nuclease family protein, partial [Spirochaetaceae bacterium]|nr:PD-(D/E)XK nuclease family protein [Spirochaetaceae bacterium]
IRIISGEIHKQSSRFVFPSEAAASLWAEKTCWFTGVRSLARGRFLAWDRFKEEVIRAAVQDREPINGVIRKLFTEKLIRKNAEAVRKVAGEQHGAEGLPFTSIIPREFAEEGAIFAAQIAALLPSLKLLKARQEAALAGTGSPAVQAAAGDLYGEPYRPDAEDRDFAVLEQAYAEFLDHNGLFEPSWERPPLKDRDHDYYLFFPEAMEDFAEYEFTLRAEPAIHLVFTEKPENRPPLRSFASSRAEIRSAVLEIRRFREEEGIPYSDMAISVPGLEDMEPYLLRELALYNIPVRRRSGRPLADHGAGRLFPLIGTCGANNFSFTALKALILNERIPWRRPDLNRALIEFGIENNCVSGYRENNREVDVWEEAFQGNKGGGLGGYYKALKSALLSLSAARTFRELRNRYFAFRGPWEEGPDRERGFLSRETCTAEADAVLGRCIEELSVLIQLETEYPDLIPPSPFSFYLSVLQEKQYVAQQQEPGVNIFPYRVAAAAPFSCHFVLNAAQGAATVLYRPLHFLRQDKRKALDIGDTDASAVFFNLYCLDGEGDFQPHPRISASDETFAGWAIPHSFFAGDAPNGGAGDTAGDTPNNGAGKNAAPGAAAGNPAAGTEALPKAPLPPDFFLLERDWWIGGPFPARLFSVQRDGFERWRASLDTPGSGFKLLKKPFPKSGQAYGLLEKEIARIQRSPIPEGSIPEGSNPEGAGGRIKVSATDLTTFFTCPGFWLYRKIFGLEEFSLEARLLDDTSLGNLYHEILRSLFTRIRETDRVFNPGRLAEYRSWLRSYTDEAARKYPAFQGPLAVPLLTSQSWAIAKKLWEVLKTEAKYFPGYAVAELETVIESVQGGILLKGKLDRVSLSPEGEPCIIDYKTGATPTAKASTETADSPLADFQIPMYIKLYEEKSAAAVGGAFFMSINKHDITAVVGSPGGKRGLPRDDYQPAIEALELRIDEFVGAVRAMDFSAREIRLTDCLGCDYRTICRTTYALNAGEGEADEL